MAKDEDFDVDDLLEAPFQQKVVGFHAFSQNCMYMQQGYINCNFKLFP